MFRCCHRLSYVLYSVIVEQSVALLKIIQSIFMSTVLCLQQPNQPGVGIVSRFEMMHAGTTLHSTQQKRTLIQVT